jgi:poly(A) polymerase
MKSGPWRASFWLTPRTVGGRNALGKLAFAGSGRHLEPLILERAEHPVSRREIDVDVLKVLYRLIKTGHTAYLVGGGVRDLMLGRKPKDFDVATTAHPQEVRALFRNSRLIGRRFRLVHVFFGPKNIEVATFRRRSEEPAPGNDLLIRHDNTFGTAEEDAFRRDFTVNALFYDPQTFRVVDYTGGVADLRARLIRTIGNPDLRMREDPVRMMRAVRFAAKLGFEIESATRAAIERNRTDLLKSAIPRVVEETYRTIGQAGAARAVLLMEQLGLLEQLMPWLSAHLKAGTQPLAEAFTIRNLAALGEAISAGVTCGRDLVLAATFLDQWLAGVPVQDSAARLDLVGELKRRGFPGADAEGMRLILDAYPRLMKPSHATRRLMRRPYFETARRLCEMTAAVYGTNTSALTRFLADPFAYLQASAATGQAPYEPGRKRRPRRRGRRGRRRRWSERANQARPEAAIGAPSPATNGLDEAPDRSGEASASAPQDHPLRGRTE